MAYTEYPAWFGISPSKHKSLYFPDGDIVIKAQNHTGHRNKVLFRVHKFMLSHHSPFFKDMLALPPPVEKQPEDEIDGVQLVEMSDRAEDIASLLEVLYDPSKLLPYKRHDPDTPLLVKGILSLATKYEVDSIRRRIVEHIKEDWPMNLLEWEEIDLRIKLYDDNEDDIGIIQLEPAAAISLARQFDIPDILPAAFLQLSRTDPSIHWDDPDVPKATPRARWNLLSQEDLMCLLRGNQALRHAVSTIPCPVARGYCRSRTKCKSVYEAVLHDCGSVDWLHNLLCLSSPSPTRDQLCKHCVEQLESNVSLYNKRVEIFEDLTEYFAL
ncbi:hypothetical protein BD410DRAFT_777707 [Rickenella mellea]|uniref:BTB domain-containing protein n=1 Tax=Rickenella mellea TaxID=50990 RepID=A0A4Y7PMI4_9AGAM|nr:hypothetical protein BD410DRAFT_777707 [Rickenella mellea]